MATDDLDMVLSFSGDASKLPARAFGTGAAAPAVAPASPPGAVATPERVARRRATQRETVDQPIALPPAHIVEDHTDFVFSAASIDAPVAIDTVSPLLAALDALLPTVPDSNRTMVAKKLLELAEKAIRLDAVKSSG